MMSMSRVSLSCVAGAAGSPSQPDELDWFALKPAVLTLAGRAALDFWRNAEKHLKSALAAQPAATELAYILVQVPSRILVVAFITHT